MSGRRSRDEGVRTDRAIAPLLWPDGFAPAKFAYDNTQAEDDANAYASALAAPAGKVCTAWIA